MSELRAQERPGLYVMVFFCLLNSCQAEKNSKEATDALAKIEKLVQPAQAAP